MVLTDWAKRVINLKEMFGYFTCLFKSFWRKKIFDSKKNKTGKFIKFHWLNVTL